MTPATLAAIRALDDGRLMQFCTLLEDWGERIALAWLCWQSETNQGSNRSAASGSDPTDGTCNFGIRRGERADCDNQPRKRVLAFRSPAVNRRAVH